MNSSDKIIVLDDKNAPTSFFLVIDKLLILNLTKISKRYTALVSLKTMLPMRKKDF